MGSCQCLPLEADPRSVCLGHRREHQQSHYSCPECVGLVHCHCSAWFNRVKDCTSTNMDLLWEEQGAVM